MALLVKLKQHADKCKGEAFALYLAARDPRTPWCARLLVAGIVAYAFSPVDLVPDFVPVIGYLDDLILIPIGISLAIRLVPCSVLSECRAWAIQTIQNKKPVNWVSGMVIVAIWLALATISFRLAYAAFIV